MRFQHTEFIACGYIDDFAGDAIVCAVLNVLFDYYYYYFYISHTFVERRR